MVQRLQSCSDNVASIPGWCVKFLTGLVAVVCLVHGEQRCFDEYGDMAAELALLSELFCGPLGILADSLAYRLMLNDTFTERAAADNLLFSRRRFFETDAGLSVLFPYGTLHNDIEIFPDDGRIRMRQLQCCCDAHCIDLFRDATSDARRSRFLLPAEWTEFFMYEPCYPG